MWAKPADNRLEEVYSVKCENHTIASKRVDQLREKSIINKPTCHSTQKMIYKYLSFTYLVLVRLHNDV